MVRELLSFKPARYEDPNLLRPHLGSVADTVIKAGHFMLFEVDSAAQGPVLPMPVSR